MKRKRIAMTLCTWTVVGLWMASAIVSDGLGTSETLTILGFLVGVGGVATAAIWVD